MRLRDWAALKAIVQRGSWDRAEPIRRALQAKIAHESGDAVGFETNWVAAVGAARSDPTNLNLLQTIASQWNWSDKATAVLWDRATAPA